MQRQCVHGPLEQCRKHAVDLLVTRDTAPGFKFAADQNDPKMRLGIGGHTVLMAFILDFEVLGGKRFAEPLFDILLHCHDRCSVVCIAH